MLHSKNTKGIAVTITTKANFGFSFEAQVAFVSTKDTLTMSLFCRVLSQWAFAVFRSSQPVSSVSRNSGTITTDAPCTAGSEIDERRREPSNGGEVLFSGESPAGSTVGNNRGSLCGGDSSIGKASTKCGLKSASSSGYAMLSLSMLSFSMPSLVMLMLTMLYLSILALSELTLSSVSLAELQTTDMSHKHARPVVVGAVVL
mmetsp:Transcript_40226/g.110602  ORF Transcript_40226/g.110602 Transcript_40226/m.110602 type:complete len:202 (-) Transcript_40226:205-810(-)